MNRPTRSSGSSANRRNPSLHSSKHHHHHHQRRDSRRRAIKLTDRQRAELDRAVRKGFLTLTAGRRHYSVENQNGSSLSYSLSPLAKEHRQWCDARGKPQIVLLKAVVGGRGNNNDGRTNGTILDQVCIDLSPLRLQALFDDRNQAANVLQKWKAEIVLAASNAGMEFLESKSSFLSVLEKDDNDYNSSPMDERSSNNNKKENWATDPIGKLPALSLGTFLGERSKAKEMTKALAKLWDIPEQLQQQEREEDDSTTSNTVHNDNNNNNGKERRRRLRYKNQRQQLNNGRHYAAPIASSGTTASVKGHKKPKITKGLSEHRTRGGGHRQSWY